MLDKEHILHLSQIKGVGKVTLNKVINYIVNENISYCEGDDDFIVNLFRNLNSKSKRIKVPSLDSIFVARAKANKIISDCEKYNIKIVGFFEKEYPINLKSINEDSPLIIYYKGNLDCLSRKCIAIIGTRKPSKYGIRAGVALSKKLAEDDVCIVSGLATGCDTIGHESALDAGIPTVAVMAGGLHSIYPEENKQLAQKIVDNNGLLISELPYGVAPSKSTFVSRNRIQSGLSEGVFIIETDVKGGTLHTVEFASIQDREIGVLFSHPINNEGDNPKFQGNKLIKEKYKSIAMNSPETIDLFMTKISDKFKTRGIVKNNFNVQTRLDF